MPSKNFYLNDNQTEAITIQYGYFFRNFELLYNDRSLGVVPDVAALRAGYPFTLPDGRIITARLLRSLGAQQIELLLNGQPIAGSGTHPQEQIKQAWYTLLTVGLLSAGAGLAAQFISNDFLRKLGLGWETALMGLIFLSLGWWGYRRQSPVAFYIALALLVLDWGLTVAALVQSGGNIGTAGFAMRFFICVFVFRGARAAQQQRKAADNQPGYVEAGY